MSDILEAAAHLEELIAQAHASPAITPIEAFVLRHLANHARGRHRAVEGSSIRLVAGYGGYKLDRRALSTIIADLIERYRLPIGTSKGRPSGYYLAVSDEDMDKGSAELWAQIRSMMRRAMVLSPKSRYGRELLGQLEAELDEEERAAA